MLILVANLGSTSFKGKLYRLPDEHVLAHAAADRIGDDTGASQWTVCVDERTETGNAPFADHGQAITLLLERFVTLGAIDSPNDIDAIGFKAVHGGPISGAVRVDDDVIDTMQSLVPLAPAHNPPYIAAMKSFRDTLPDVPQVACFETAFHSTIPAARTHYGVPHEWATNHGIRKYGFHGASNAYLAQRMAELAPDQRKLITLHLGGSCSVGAIADGQSVYHSMGSTPQTGVFHANRVGDFDPYALRALRAAGLSDDDIDAGLSKQGGLLGLSGVSADTRDVEAAAEQGNAQAQLALDAFVEHCRHHLGAALVALNGADAIVFTAGIGQHSPTLRAAICADLTFAGVTLDTTKNTNAPGNAESRIDADSDCAVWVLPTNEELIVARQTASALNPAPTP